jgi:hypothetical protein
MTLNGHSVVEAGGNKLPASGIHLDANDLCAYAAETTEESAGGNYDSEM